MERDVEGKNIGGRRGGRPPLHGEHATRRLDLNLTQSQMRQIEEAAGDRPLRVYAREVLLRQAAVSGVPLWGTVSAGSPDECSVEQIGTVYCSEHPSGPQFGYLEVRGDSMDRQVPDGALALIKRGQIYSSGQTVAARIEWPNHCEYCLKVYRDAGGSGILLEPDSTNRAHRTIVLQQELRRGAIDEDDSHIYMSPECVVVEGVYTGDFIYSRSRVQHNNHRA